MPSVGVRGLKIGASKILRKVRDRGEVYEITLRGKTIARLVPVQSRADDKEFNRFWTDLDELAAEIGAQWPKKVSAARAVKEGRREL